MKTADFNRFSVHLPDAAVPACSASGAVDEAVAYWAQFADVSEINIADLRAELAEYGAWNEKELSSHEQNIRRIIWIAAGNISDDERETARR